MKCDVLKNRLQHNSPIFLHDREVEVIEYQEIFNIAFVKYKGDPNSVFAIDMMVLFEEPNIEKKINIDLLDFL